MLITIDLEDLIRASNEAAGIILGGLTNIGREDSGREKIAAEAARIIRRSIVDRAKFSHEVDDPMEATDADT